MAGVITEINVVYLNRRFVHGVGETMLRKMRKEVSQSAKVKNPLYISIIWALNESKFRNLRKQVAKLAKPL